MGLLSLPLQWSFWAVMNWQNFGEKSLACFAPLGLLVPCLKAVFSCEHLQRRQGNKHVDSVVPNIAYWCCCVNTGGEYLGLFGHASSFREGEEEFFSWALTGIAASLCCGSNASYNLISHLCLYFAVHINTSCPTAVQSKGLWFTCKKKKGGDLHVSKRRFFNFMKAVIFE